MDEGGDSEMDNSMTTVCSILQKMLEKAGITKTCEEILKTMADTQRYTVVSKNINKSLIVFAIFRWTSF